MDQDFKGVASTPQPQSTQSAGGSGPIAPTQGGQMQEPTPPQKQSMPPIQSYPETQSNAPSSTGKPDVVKSSEGNSKFKLFIIISIVLIVLIWGGVAYLYFQR